MSFTLDLKLPPEYQIGRDAHLELCAKDLHWWSGPQRGYDGSPFVYDICVVCMKTRPTGWDKHGNRIATVLETRENKDLN